MRTAERAFVTYFAMGAVGVSCLLLGTIRPVFLAIVLLTFCFINPTLLPNVDYGELSLRPGDIVVVILTVAIICRLLMTRRSLLPRDLSRFVSPCLPFLVWIGVSLFWSEASGSSEGGRAVVSFLRLVSTVWWAFLVYHSATTRADLRTMTYCLLGLAVGSVALGALEAFGGIVVVPDRELGERFGGVTGLSALGLVAAMLLVYAALAWSRGGSRRLLGILAMAGMIGLFLSRSGSAVLATGCALLVASKYRPTPLRAILARLQSNTLIPATIVGALCLLAVYLLRPDDMSGLVALNSGSFAHRLMLAYAGVLLFLCSPIAGLGWQASRGQAAFDSATAEKLLGAFPQMPIVYFPTSTELSLHNFYIQVLAELGIVGIVLLAWGLFRISRRARDLLRIEAWVALPSIVTEFSCFTLVAVLVWWNANPLFGGQTESLLAFALLGMLARQSSITRGLLRARRTRELLSGTEPTEGHDAETVTAFDRWHTRTAEPLGTRAPRGQPWSSSPRSPPA